MKADGKLSEQRSFKHYGRLKFMNLKKRKPSCLSGSANARARSQETPNLPTMMKRAPLKLHQRQKKKKKKRNKFSIPFLLLWTPDLHNRFRPGDSSSCHICGILHGFPSQSDNFYKTFFQSTQHLQTTSTPARGLFWGHHAVLQYS